MVPPSHSMERHNPADLGFVLAHIPRTRSLHESQMDRSSMAISSQFGPTPRVVPSSDIRNEGAPLQWRSKQFNHRL